MSLKIISNINSINDNLTFAKHGLNCFSVARYLASAAFSSINPTLFYCYVYFFCHYNLLEEFYPELVPTIEGVDQYAIEKFVLANKLGLKLVTANSNNLLNSIKENLDQDYPVFVPINKNFWSNFSNNEPSQETEPYLLLIKGYNPATNVLVVQDLPVDNSLLSIQIPGLTYSENASQVYILTDVLEQANKSYNLSYNPGQIYQIEYLKRTSAIAIQTPTEALADILSQLSAYIENITYLIRPKFNFIETLSPENLNLILNYINNQQIFIYSLTHLLKTEQIDLNLIDEIYKAGSAAWLSWKKYAMLKAICLKTKKVNESILRELNQSYFKIYNEEHHFLNTIYKLKSIF